MQTVSTPQLQLETLFVLDDRMRIVRTREPDARRGPLFVLIRSATSCAWAVRSDVSASLFGRLEQLAREEPPVADLRAEPLHADAYRLLLGGQVQFGPAFEFPRLIPAGDPVQQIASEDVLEAHFHGWRRGEIGAGRGPVMAVMAGGRPVSICFCARRSAFAAEAGIETAEAYRARGFATRVTAAWALAIRASGLVPLYSTSWHNDASLAVARKLRLIPYASDWSIV